MPSIILRYILTKNTSMRSHREHVQPLLCSELMGYWRKTLLATAEQQQHGERYRRDLTQVTGALLRSYVISIN